MKIDADSRISNSYNCFWNFGPIHRLATGNILLNDVMHLFRGGYHTLLRNGISQLTELPCIIIKNFESYTVLFTLAVDFETAGATILNQIEPFLIGTF